MCMCVYACAHMPVDEGGGNSCCFHLRPNNFEKKKMTSNLRKHTTQKYYTWSQAKLNMKRDSMAAKRGRLENKFNDLAIRSAHKKVCHFGTMEQ